MPVAKLNRRQQQILEQVQRDGFASIDSLAQDFDVTSQTIRRDINQLCEEGLLRRYHGGAGVPSSAENLPYDRRQVQALEEKRRIARLVARQVPDRASLFIDVGTTTEEIAKALLNHQQLRIITNNLNVAQILAAKQSFEIIVTGGIVRPEDRAVVGEQAVEVINQFKVDIGILGASGIDQDGSLLDFDVRKVRVSKAIIANSRYQILAVDHSKIGRNAMVRSAHVSEIDEVIMDRDPPVHLKKQLEDAEVILRVASPQ